MLFVRVCVRCSYFLAAQPHFHRLCPSRCQCKACVFVCVRPCKQQQQTNEQNKQQTTNILAARQRKLIVLFAIAVENEHTPVLSCTHTHKTHKQQSENATTARVSLTTRSQIFARGVLHHNEHAMAQRHAQTTTITHLNTTEPLPCRFFLTLNNSFIPVYAMHRTVVKIE